MTTDGVDAIEAARLAVYRAFAAPLAGQHLHRADEIAFAQAVVEYGDLREQWGREQAESLRQANIILGDAIQLSQARVRALEAELRYFLDERRTPQRTAQARAVLNAQEQS